MVASRHLIHFKTPTPDSCATAVAQTVHINNILFYANATAHFPDLSQTQHDREYPRLINRLTDPHCPWVSARAWECQCGELDFLAGRKVVIEVTDFGFLFMLQLIDKSINVSSCCEEVVAEPDLWLKANSVDFFLLCSAQVDPDTLFFQRRLSMIGDTELGLYLKNFLDSFDTKARLPKALWRAQQFIAMQLLSEPKQ
jgi:predicted lipid carrier protein YhbT